LHWTAQYSPVPGLGHEVNPLVGPGEPQRPPTVGRNLVKQPDMLQRGDVGRRCREEQLCETLEGPTLIAAGGQRIDLPAEGGPGLAAPNQSIRRVDTESHGDRIRRSRRREMRLRRTRRPFRQIPVCRSSLWPTRAVPPAGWAGRPSEPSSQQQVLVLGPDSPAERWYTSRRFVRWIRQRRAGDQRSERRP